MVLVAGLGNPGKKYSLTRHNLGFLVLDFLARHYQRDFNKTQFNALVTEGTFSEHKLILAKPQSFMNNSGHPIGALSSFYKIIPENIIVVHDEVDLPFGDVRLKTKGGTAGHKGVESVYEHLKTDQFKRIRMGIGRPIQPLLEIADYVLLPFSLEEQKELSNLYKKACELLEKTLAALKEP